MNYFQQNQSYLMSVKESMILRIRVDHYVKWVCIGRCAILFDKLNFFKSLYFLCQLDIVFE
uniref:Uncharacterized protein n=1 Tax=Nelumbo nucifera TaxID=4432 RepID=A0A822ZGZ4_NELNU|nr:TPA_asm: hypothetical protein HUJ06_001171 [Nelumbo nucifera]